MKKSVGIFLPLYVTISLLIGCGGELSKPHLIDSPKSLPTAKITKSAHPKTRDKDERMTWWREARFGMFIHFGLYAILAGEWKNQNDHGEWIRTSAEIPLGEYEKLADKFNPLKFDAEKWVSMAKQAGMRYIVVTTKHHDGFCLFDSNYTDFDVMATPFERDMMKELADACQKYGIKMCWYHSIMDWHHPDYLPRRDWETDRSTEGADMNRYVEYLKNQLKELTTKYGDIGVLWFDGEWEKTWTHEHGVGLYNYVRSFQPNIIINNRVDVDREGMAGFTKGEGRVGDFGTPEQEVPDTGLPGVDWETCMTMNTHWGYNKADKEWKSSKDLIQKLADIASKGGNFLLNIGPKADGTFPEEAVARLADIGKWMSVNSESVYGTKACPWEVPAWGRCTQKIIDGKARLFLHVFNWPKGGKLSIAGVQDQLKRAFLLADVKKQPLTIKRSANGFALELPKQAPDPMDSVVVIDIAPAGRV